MANLERQVLGRLDSHIITANSPKLLVVFCHGFGAPGDDLVPVGAQLLQQFPSLLDQVEFVFPAAPLSLADYGMPQGRAWWPLDIEALMSGTRDFKQMRTSTPDMLPNSRAALAEAINGRLEKLGLTRSQLVLGGFSQGSMIATDIALQGPTPPGALVIWSGALICEPDWTQKASILNGVPVIQSHGRSDEILPYEVGTALRDMLTQAGANLNFISFDGPHTIPHAAMNATGSLLVDLLN